MSGGDACLLGSRGWGEGSGGGACSLGPRERRAAEAHAQGQRKPVDKENKTRHETIIFDSVNILKSSHPYTNGGCMKFISCQFTLPLVTSMYKSFVTVSAQKRLKLR